MLVRICKAINIDAHFKGCRRRGGGMGEICMFYSSEEWFVQDINKKVMCSVLTSLVLPIKLVHKIMSSLLPRVMYVTYS
jgi:hypothetical protein